MANEFVSSVDELLHIADELESLTMRGNQEEIKKPLEELAQVVEQVSKAWSGSWIGYHANVYYKGLQAPPQGRISVRSTV